MKQWSNDAEHHGTGFHGRNRNVQCRRGACRAVAARSSTTIKNDLNYLIYTPDDYASSSNAYPLVVGYTAGSGRDRYRESQIEWHSEIDRGGKEIPLLVFSPQNPSEELLYPIEKVEAALDEVMSKYRVRSRACLCVGFSRGAFAAWAMAEQFPETFAAVVPIAGAAIRHYVSRTNEKAAFWVFHGTNDQVIPLSDSVVLMSGLWGLKRNARLSVLEGVDQFGRRAGRLERSRALGLAAETAP